MLKVQVFYYTTVILNFSQMTEERGSVWSYLILQCKSEDLKIGVSLGFDFWRGGYLVSGVLAVPINGFQRAQAPTFLVVAYILRFLACIICE